MAIYKVSISSAAERDLLDIVGYISPTLKEPAAAKRIYQTIKEKIKTLRKMPDRHGMVRDENFAQMGVRQLFVENYTVFYVIDEEANNVNILRILYNRRDWQYLLGD